MSHLSIPSAPLGALLAPLLGLGLAACSSKGPPDGSPPGDARDAAASPLDARSTALDGSASGATRFRGEAWADNWFSLSVGDVPIAEDSVPITTERSFNAERFEFEGEYPLVLAFVIKDFMQNDSGLEYIGAPNQQMGDGGFVFQLTDLDRGSVVLVSDHTWRCHAIHRAPLDKTCEKDPDPLRTCRSEIEPEPAGWRAADFDDGAWAFATEFSAAAVGPKEGYYQVSWSPEARFIWTSDLETDNIILCRARVLGP